MVKRILIILLKSTAGIVGLGLLTIAGIILYALATDRSGGAGRWKSEAARETYEQAYREVMASMPPASATHDIPTTFGTVRVYEWTTNATAGKIPIVLMPGRSAGVPMWLGNLPDLIKERPVYALDALGDSGFSVQTAKIKDTQDQAKLLDETFSALGLSKIHLIGHSFGGWNAANFANFYPERLQSLILLEPVFTLQPIRLSLMLKLIPATIPFLPDSIKKSFLTEIGGSGELNLNDPLARMISVAADGFSSHLPNPSQITLEQMHQWNFPVFVGLGGKSPIQDTAKAEQTAKENIRALTIKVWQDGTHSLPMEYAAEIDRMILDFTKAADGN